MVSFVATLLFSLMSTFASNSILLSVDMKGSHKQHSGKDTAEEHIRWLEISASSMSLIQPAQVTLEWHFFADDLKADEVVEHVKGSEVIEMQPGKVVEIKTKETVFSYVRQHAERVSGGRRASYKRVEATGTRYHGWGVRALMDGKVIAEAFSSRDIAKLVESP
jgi:hypothetical protein